MGAAELGASRAKKMEDLTGMITDRSKCNFRHHDDRSSSEI
jgi:hypothetical protein